MTRGGCPIPNKLTFVQFVKIYPSIDEISFIGFFTVIDVMALRLLCKDCASVFNEDLQQQVIRLGNLDNAIRLNFWVIQAPFFEIENELKKLLNLGSIFANVYEHLRDLHKKTPIPPKVQNQILM